MRSALRAIVSSIRSRSAASGLYARVAEQPHGRPDGRERRSQLVGDRREQVRPQPLQGRQLRLDLRLPAEGAVRILLPERRQHVPRPTALGRCDAHETEARQPGQQRGGAVWSAGSFQDPKRSAS